MTPINYQVIVASVLEKGGCFLCIEEMVDGSLKLNQPAGRLEVGETPSHGAVREALEESGYSFLPTHLIGIYEYFDVKSRNLYIRLAYTGAVFAPVDILARPADPHIHAVHWLTYEELDHRRERHRSPFVMQCVTDYRAGKSYPLDLVTHFSASPVM